MKSEDFEFKKTCQATYSKVCGLLAKNRTKEAFDIINEMEKRAIEWEEHERSVKLRSRLMQTLTLELISKRRQKTAELKQGRMR
jgi:hypothetical protein